MPTDRAISANSGPCRSLARWTPTAVPIPSPTTSPLTQFPDPLPTRAPTITPAKLLRTPARASLGTPGDRYRLEYPAGRMLYQSLPGGYLSDIRVSPRGDRLALFAHDLLSDDRGIVLVVDTAGRADTLGSEYKGLEGLAWADPRSLVFSGAGLDGAYQVHRAELGGAPRLALPSAGSLTLMDAVR